MIYGADILVTALAWIGAVLACALGTTLVWILICMIREIYRQTMKDDGDEDGKAV